MHFYLLHMQMYYVHIALSMCHQFATRNTSVNVANVCKTVQTLSCLSGLSKRDAILLIWFE